MSRVPTLKQARRLRILGAGAIVIAPRRADWMPLLRHQWVERASDSASPRGGFLPPLRITSAGLRALADAVDRHHPALTPDLRPRGPDPSSEPPA